MHKPYIENRGHQADFRVKYRFYTIEEGGRKLLPFQGLRCDFVYDNIDTENNRAYIICPEFEDSNGEIILDNTKAILEKGTARMWIIINERREYHKERIKIGTKCYFFEGKRTAECEVIEILGLFDNPVK